MIYPYASSHEEQWKESQGLALATFWEVVGMGCWKRVVLIPLALCLVLVGCAPSATPARDGSAAEARPATVRRIAAAMMGNPPTVVQRTIGGGTGNIPGISQLEALLSPGLSLVGDKVRRPIVAEAVPSAENGLWKLFPDGRMETTWRIRQNARWHDGAPVTAEDLLFTSRVDLDPAFPIPRSAASSFIDRMEAPDPSTLKVTWKQPFIEADRLFSGAVFPRHILEQPYHEAKETLMALSYWTTEFVGTGPYKVRQWVQDSHVVLAANEGYALGRPRIDEMVVKFIADENTFMANILAGEVDVTIGKSVTLEQTLSIKAQWPHGHVEIWPTNSLKLWPQFIDANPLIITNVQFRKALVHAMNRQEMVDTIMGGLSEVAHTILLPTDPELKDVEAALVKYEYDPRKATQMIEALGYAKGADGMFRDRAGQRLVVEINATNEDQNTKPMFAVADYWQRIGVGVDAVVIPIQRQRDAEYRATFPGFNASGGGSGVDAIKSQHGSQARLPETRYTGGNYSRYINSEFDAMIDRFLSTVDYRERLQALRAVVHHMTDQLTQINTYYATSSTMIANKMRNVGADPTWNAYEWDVN